MASSSGRKIEPRCVLVIGMAGSGKTSLMQRLNAFLHAKSTPPYLMNLDPAVSELPYAANVDIRDTVHYKRVMKEYNLGPNGGILTSANLFATRFDQVISLVEKRMETVENFLVDTPGQIEIFTWSASGQIVSEALAGTLPTVIAFVVDTPRCLAPQTFMANMLQAVSILYKMRLPMVLVFNKIDVARHEFALEWMKDFETFHAALDQSPSYGADLSRSLSLVLEDFYTGMRAVGVSAMTGEGVEEFFEAVGAAVTEYNTEFLPDLQQRREQKAAEEQKHKEAQAAKLKRDLDEAIGGEKVAMALKPGEKGGLERARRGMTAADEEEELAASGGEPYEPDSDDEDE
mmetsp:Transcript_14740/g.48342  ORF Transcript_14740/g.48342 Transcript_14740/m.48342 type:complete len:346 (+) Transcript_14740:3-1040(+)